jgi:hypothetical protein
VVCVLAGSAAAAVGWAAADRPVDFIFIDRVTCCLLARGDDIVVPVEILRRCMLLRKARVV